jgi:ABC-type Fe3+ transport system substrate-binding protein
LTCITGPITFLAAIAGLQPGSSPQGTLDLIAADECAVIIGWVTMMIVAGGNPSLSWFIWD